MSAITSQTAACSRTGKQLLSRRRSCVKTLVIFPISLLLAFAANAGGAPLSQYVPGQLLVKPQKGLSETEFAARLRVHGAVHRQTLRRLNVRILNLPEERLEAVLAALRNDPGIEFAERDGIARATFVPNDPYVVSGAEWHLPRIEAPAAWNLTTGNSHIIVAVLDSGVNFSHPDLAGKLLPGYDFVSGTANPADDFGHGTAVTGVIAADANNGIGVAGIAYDCMVLPVKVMDASGFATYSCLAQGLRYAVDQGARVVNISIAGTSPSLTLQAAIEYAWSNNVVVVAAAGNSASSTAQYPAACAHVLAVSATEPDDSLASFSSYGGFISLAAPGDNIWTTQYDLSNPYGAWRGTSFASPVVASVAALALSANPFLSNTQVVSLLEQTADDVGDPGYETRFGYGRVNAYAAVSAANPQLAATNSSGPIPPTVFITNPPEGGVFSFGTTVSLSAMAFASTGEVASVTFQANGNSIGAVPLPPFNLSWSPSMPGTYLLAAIATDTSGLSSTSAPVSITISDATTTSPQKVFATLTIQTNGWGRVNPNLNGRQLEVGRTYTVREVPGPMQMFAGWSDEPAQGTVRTFVMQSNLTLVANFVPTPFPSVKGSYAGLLSDTNAVTPQNSGFFTLAITAMGRFSGSLRNAGKGYGFTGRFGLDGNAQALVRRGSLSPLTLTLHVELSNDTEQVSGSVSDGGWASTLFGNRNVFSARWKPALQAGQRLFILQPANAPAITVATGASQISSGGATRVHGKLDDGRSFGVGSSLSRTGDCPFYLSLNHGNEVVIGWLNFPITTPLAQGTVVWVKTGTNAFAATLKATGI